MRQFFGYRLYASDCAVLDY